MDIDILTLMADSGRELPPGDQVTRNPGAWVRNLTEILCLLRIRNCEVAPSCRVAPCRLFSVVAGRSLRTVCVCERTHAADIVLGSITRAHAFPCAAKWGHHSIPAFANVLDFATVERIPPPRSFAKPLLRLPGLRCDQSLSR